MENKSKLDDEKSKVGAVLNTQLYGRLNKRKHEHVEKENLKTSNSSNKLDSNQNESQTISSTNQKLNANASTSSKNKFKKRRNKKNSLQKKPSVASKYEQKKPTLLQKVSPDMQAQNILIHTHFLTLCVINSSY